MAYYNELVFTEAVEQVEAIVESSDGNEIATRIERLVTNPDLAMAAMMLLVFKIKKVGEGITGIELANTQPTVNDLWLPSDFGR